MRKLLLLLGSCLLLATCSGDGAVVQKEDVDAGSDVEVVTADNQAEMDAAPIPPCGDGECETEKGENCSTCEEDCGGPCCGNGNCDVELGETCSTCPEDCDVCKPVCGDGICDPDHPEFPEDCTNCPEDCVDCPEECGNGEKEGDEECDDGNTDPDDGCDEECKLETDCPNGTCEEGENCENCPDDCPDDCCGNGECDDALGETCETCPDDCCEPGCGDGIVQAEDGEQCDDGNIDPDDGCDEECKLEPVAAEEGDILITEIMKDPSIASDTDGEWFELYNTTEYDIDINGWHVVDDGMDDHTIFMEGGVVVPGESFFVMGRSNDQDVNGGVAVDYVYGGVEGETFNLANKDDEVILKSGSTIVDEVKYDNGETFPDQPGISMSLTPDAFDDEGNDDGGNWCNATTSYGDGDLGSPGADNPACAGAICGDGECNGDEVCDECLEDCGPCPIPCPDGECADDETCETCPDDCGLCPECPDGECNGEETCETCEADCGPCPLCPNGECADGETCQTCEADCGPCPACPDGECNGQEDCLTCEEDCGPCCPNEICEFFETCDSCEADCGTCDFCPNGACDNGETCSTCEADCGPCCPNGACDNGETCSTCEADCGVCPTCPNGACDNGETCSTCEADCGPCPTCPNGACDNGETCSTCEADCGPCPSEGWCELSGNQGDEVTCTLDLAAEHAESPKATGAEFMINFDSAKLTFTKFHDENCDLVPGMCIDWDTPPQGTLVPTNHTITYQEQAPGAIKTIIYHASQPTTPITPAHFSGASLVGDSSLVEMVFTLNQNISANQAVQVTLTGLKATDADANSLGMTNDEGMLITTGGGPAPVCPDGDCNGDETCTTCPTDCGQCPAACPDGDCNGNETCSTCPADCGECPPACPDGDCNGNETCTTCPADCGQCPAACPDGDCNGNETCGTCPQDCGACPECGDGDCNGAETCDSCEDDCGACPSSSWCSLSGSQGAEVSCSLELAAENGASSKATGAEFVLNFDSAKLTFVKFHDENCDLVPGMCFDWDTPPQGSLVPTNHTITFNEQAPGKIKTLIYHASQPTTAITDAYMSGANVVGDGSLVDIVFTLNQTISAGQPTQPNLSDMKATDADANSLEMTMQDGVLVTSTQ